MSEAISMISKLVKADQEMSMMQMSTDLPTFLQNVVAGFAYIKKHNVLPKRHSTVARSISFGACVIGCSPFIAWSIIWRIIACPFQICYNGLGFCCSTNKCTEITDAALIGIYDGINESAVLMPLNYVIDTEKIDESTRTFIREYMQTALITWLSCKTTDGLFTRAHYKMIDYAGEAIKYSFKNIKVIGNYGGKPLPLEFEGILQQIVNMLV